MALFLELVLLSDPSGGYYLCLSTFISSCSVSEKIKATFKVTGIEHESRQEMVFHCEEWPFGLRSKRVMEEPTVNTSLQSLAMPERAGSLAFPVPFLNCESPCPQVTARAAFLSIT